MIDVNAFKEHINPKLPYTVCLSSNLALLGLASFTAAPDVKELA